jgi:prophage regulatory protein
MFHDHEFQPRTPPFDRLIRRPEVMFMTGLKRSTLYEKMSAGTFPAQVSIGGNMVAWRESEVLRWIANPT